MPIAHDPTLPGWLTALAYLGAGWLAAAAARAAARDRRPEDWRAAAFWTGAAVFMALLAINKQADLQTALTNLLRREARIDGWYEQRRHYQLLFIAVMAGAGVAGAGALAWWVRKESRPVRMGAVGLMLTSVFVTVRAASFHHHDVIGRIEFAGFRAHVLFEWACIALVAGSAALAQSRSVRIGEPAKPGSD